MCSPDSLGKVITVSTAVSAVGNLVEGKQAKAYYNYKGDQAEADANYEIGAAAVRASRVRKAGTYQQGEVAAGYAASGIDVTQGTPMTTREALDRNISLDATMQLLTGQRRAAILRAEAQGDRIAGDRALAGGMLSASRSILSGVSTYMNAQNARDKWIRRTQIDSDAEAAARFKEFGSAGDFYDD